MVRIPAQACLGEASHPLIPGSTWEHPRGGGDRVQLGSTAAALPQDHPPEPRGGGWLAGEAPSLLGASPADCPALSRCPQEHWEHDPHAAPEHRV